MRSLPKHERFFIVKLYYCIIMNLKRLFFLLVMCFVWLVSYAQNQLFTISKIYLMGGEKQCRLTEKDMFLYIKDDGVGEDVIFIDVSDLPKFREAFSLANEKYKEWKK